MKKFMMVFALAGATAYAQSAGDVQKMLTAEGAKLRALGTDPAVVAAVKAQNANKRTLDAVKAIDAQWAAGKAEALVKQSTTGACADRLRQLIAGGNYSETFAMDAQGAIVCATAKTSDYWQGDEAKWEKAFNGGRGDVFIDRPKFDESANARIAQVSVPVMDGGKAIGAVTVGVIIR